MLKNLLPPTATFIELRKFVNFIQNGSTLPFSLSVPRTHRIEGTKGAGLHSPPPVPWQGRRKEFPGSKFNLQCLKKIRALPGIILAEMSYHSFENDSENVSHIPEDLENEILESVNEMGDLIN